MIRSLLLGSLVSGLILSGAYNRPSPAVQGAAVEHYVSDPGSVGFDIELLQGGDGSSQWMATYAAEGHVAKFRIELGQATALDDKESKDFGFKTGEGRFVSEAGSDASVLLADLRKALEAKNVHAKAKKVSFVPFTFVTLGERQSQAADGGFSSEPPGNWTPMKIFIGKGKNEAEVFLNLNPVIKKGQFSIKDADYGDLLLAQLAKVL